MTQPEAGGLSPAAGNQRQVRGCRPVSGTISAPHILTTRKDGTEGVRRTLPLTMELIKTVWEEGNEETLEQITDDLEHNQL